MSVASTQPIRASQRLHELAWVQMGKADSASFDVSLHQLMPAEMNVGRVRPRVGPEVNHVRRADDLRGVDRRL
jgi:hypothetical protein